MNENEIKDEEVETRLPSDEKAAADPADDGATVLDASIVASDDKNAVEERSEREALSISDEEKRAALRDPMFFAFANGKDGKMDDIISDFCLMLRDGGREERISSAARITPTCGAISPEYALSERQRRIARDAGMSCREYYGFLKSMKNI